MPSSLPLPLSFTISPSLAHLFSLNLSTFLRSVFLFSLFFPPLLSPSVGGHSIFNHHGRLSVQGRRGEGGGEIEREQGREGGKTRDLCYELQEEERKRVWTVLACRHITADTSRSYKKAWESCVCAPSRWQNDANFHLCLSPSSSSHQHQTNIFTIMGIVTRSGSLPLYCKPSPWTEADFQGESPLRGVIEQDLHFNPCPWKRKSVCDLWLLNVIYYQRAQRDDTVSCRLLRKSTSTRSKLPNLNLGALMSCWKCEVIKRPHMYVKLGYICGHKQRRWTGHMSDVPEGSVTARYNQ